MLQPRFRPFGLHKVYFKSDYGLLKKDKTCTPSCNIFYNSQSVLNTVGSYRSSTNALPGLAVSSSFLRTLTGSQVALPCMTHNADIFFQTRNMHSVTYYDDLPSEVKNEILATSRLPQTGVSLRHILDFGNQQPMDRQVLLSARFLHRELPIRLSHRIAELEALPPGLSSLPQIKRTMGWYAESFVAFKRFSEVRDAADVRTLTKLLRDAVKRHSKVVPVVAKGVQLYKFAKVREKALFTPKDGAPFVSFDEQQADPEEEVLQHFLDSFFLSRIALRFLAGHHIAIYDSFLHHQNYQYLHRLLKQQEEQEQTSAASEDQVVVVVGGGAEAKRPRGGVVPGPTLKRGNIIMPPPPRDRIGLVHTQLSPVKVAAAAAEEARAVCLAAYGSSPDVEIYGPPALRMAYVQGHLHHCVFELVKNSLRAVQDRFQGDDLPPPPVKVIVAEGMEDVTIKVSDQGAGISRKEMRKIWTYLYTTADSPLPDMDEDTNEVPTVLAGYGCGLPLSRLYARYFGGDLQLISMDGYGTDAYLHLNRLGTAEEPLPGDV